MLSFKEFQAFLWLKSPLKNNQSQESSSSQAAMRNSKNQKKKRNKNRGLGVQRGHAKPQEGGILTDCPGSPASPGLPWKPCGPWDVKRRESQTVKHFLHTDSERYQ